MPSPGSVSCTLVTGTVNFDPPITLTGDLPETITFSLSLGGCTATGNGAVQVTSGTATATIKAARNHFLTLNVPQPVAFAVTWEPNSVHASVILFSSYALLIDTSGHAGFTFPSAGTAQVAGSYPGSDNGAKSTLSFLTSTTNQQMLDTSKTSTGVGSLDVVIGTFTLS